MGLDWRVYYDSGATFSDADGGPEQAPALGVQVIVKRDTSGHVDNVGRRVLSQWNYYWWRNDDEQWYGGDLFGLFDYLQCPGWKRVLFGRSVPNQTFLEIRRRAFADPDFPRYTGSEQP